MNNNLKNELVKIAKEDIKIARYQGSVMITDTKYGTVELVHFTENKLFSMYKVGSGDSIVERYTAKEMIDMLCNTYQVVNA